MRTFDIAIRIDVVSRSRAANDRRRRSARAIGALAAISLLVGMSNDVAAKPPNIILIVGDDQGFTDFGFMGHATIRTPHLDRLAEQSARFRHGYVPSSLCRPSLATLLTGLYPHQHGIHFNDPPDKRNRQQAERLIRQVPTLPRLLKSAGYRNFQTGKFWEGHYSNAGFDEGMSHGDPTRGGRHGDEGLKIGRNGLKPIFDFIDRQGETPFFIWYAPMMPHTPFDPPERHRRTYADVAVHPHVRLYYAMCSWFDETVGELLSFLDDKGLTDSTLVIFVIDNGWITSETSPTPQFAPKSKRSPYEMGTRTPILVRWPGHVPPGERVELVSSVDIVPTILAAAGIDDPKTPLPGANLLPICSGEERLSRKAVFGAIFEHDASRLDHPASDLLYRWVRMDRFKLMDARAPSSADHFFDLERDPREEHDEIDQPDRQRLIADMRRMLDEWWRVADEPPLRR
jgi:uncharacterized sulfatase